MKEEKIIRATWRDYAGAVQRIRSHIMDIIELREESGIEPFAGVYGIPRGGLVLAVHLSHCLELPLLAAPAESCIIVDDIFDSGATLRPLSRYVLSGQSEMLVWYINKDREEECKQRDIFFVDMKNPDEWINFPWEE